MNCVVVGLPGLEPGSSSPFVEGVLPLDDSPLWIGETRTPFCVRSSCSAQIELPTRCRLSRGGSRGASNRRKRPRRMQHFLKAAARAARARVVATELLLQPFVLVDDPQPSFDMRL